MSPPLPTHPPTVGSCRSWLTTNPKNQTLTTQYEPSRGKTTAVIDIAGHRTDAVYDPLGRLTAVWKPGQPKVACIRPRPPTTTSCALMVPARVTTHALVDYGPKTNYVNTINLYDGMGQLRQTQTDAEGGGRVVKDVFYDSHGWARISNNRYYTDGTPATTMVAVADSAVDDRTITAYDGSGRATLATAYRGLTATWSTRTIYGGDRTTTIPPQGGVPATTVVDARGKTTELDQYTSPPVVDDATGKVTGGAPQITRYHYTPTGLQDSVTDTNNVAWTSRYDFLGRKISQTDPDTGASTTSYDLRGQIISTTDSRGQTLSYDYDELGRKTAEHDGPLTGPKLAEWTYDTLQAGKLTSSVRHTPGGDYISAVTDYDGKGRPESTYVTIPDSETGLSGDHLTTFSFTTTDQMTMLHPAPGGGLPNEILHTSYDPMGKPLDQQGDFDYVTGTQYTPFGEAAQYRLSSLNNAAWLTYAYDPQTRRLTGQNLSAQTADARVSDLKYTYDPAGNPTKTVESRGLNGQIRAQCYQYDTLDRLSQAWTATDDCAKTPTTTPGSANIGGPNPYWTTWTFEPGGLRTQQTQHALPGASGDTVTTYTYPAATVPQPHTLTSTSTTSPTGPGTAGSQDGRATATATRATAYTYDQAGNTLTRTLPTGQQTLTWNQDNRLATVTTTGGQSSYIYDADGNELIRHDPNTTTLYLPGEELTRDNKTGTVTGTRYYSHNGTTVALRVGDNNPKYLLSDPHGTGQTTADSVSRAITRRDLDPYGNTVGSVEGGPWPDQHGFLGKPHDDATGLTDIGARNYDPTTGRFISADPLLQPANPEQLNGYTYSGDNPITASDPTGLACSGPDGIGCRAPASHTPQDYTPIGKVFYEFRRNLWRLNQMKRELSIRNRQKWIRQHSPRDTDSAGARADLQTHSKDANGEDFWQAGVYRDPSTGDINYTCFGRTACWEAAKYLQKNRDDVEGARIIAATYCLTNFDQCKRDAAISEAGATLLSLAFAFAGGAESSRGDVAREAAAFGCNSFVPDTLVVMADGTTKPIKDIKPGDQVLATDPVTGNTQAEPVTALIVEDHEDKTLVDITITDDTHVTQPGTIITTDYHPLLGPHPASMDSSRSPTPRQPPVYS